jgi:hypothetical protein
VPALAPTADGKEPHCVGEGQGHEQVRVRLVVHRAASRCDGRATAASRAGAAVVHGLIGRRCWSCTDLSRFAAALPVVPAAKPW